jgi:hypothetical protein
MRNVRTHRWRRNLALATGVLALGIPSIARADEGRDLLYLRDGSVLRGTVVDITPGVAASIRLESGAAVVVPRLDTMRIEQTTAPAPALAVASARDASLQASNGPVEQTRARSPSKGWYAVGLIGLGVGGLTATGALLLAAEDVELPCLMGGSCGSIGTDLGPVLAVAAGGAAVAIAGWVLMKENAPTTTSQDIHPLPPTASAWRRPAFEGPSADPKGYPPVAALPLLSGRF